MAKKIAPKGATEKFLRESASFSGEECLMWPFGTNSRGYGLAVIGGKQMGAHRWMCILAHGQPSERDSVAAHNCGVPGCVNPRHLRWDTHAGNMADKKKHGTEIYGERNGKTNLTEMDVRRIRAAPPVLAPLMAEYGMTKHAISKIRSGKRWGHVK